LLGRTLIVSSSYAFIILMVIAGLFLYFGAAQRVSPLEVGGGLDRKKA